MYLRFRANQPSFNSVKRTNRLNLTYKGGQPKHGNPDASLQLLHSPVRSSLHVLVAPLCSTSLYDISGSQIPAYRL
jgi:hypothetical protein